MHVHKAAKWIPQVAMAGLLLHWPLCFINLTILTLNLLDGRKGPINLMRVEAHKSCLPHEMMRQGSQVVYVTCFFLVIIM